MIRRIAADSVIRRDIPRRLGSQPDDELSAATPEKINEAEVQHFHDGYTDGFEAGRREGLLDVQLQVDALKETLARQLEVERSALVDQREGLVTLCMGIKEQVDAHFEATERTACQIAFECMEHMLGKLHQDNALVSAFCESVIRDNRCKTLRLLVCPDDASLMPQHIEGVDIVSDVSVSRWSCRLETENGAIEADLLERLSASYRGILGLLEAKTHVDAD